MSRHLLKLIQQGEHQQQDFKFCINDSRKIAKSLVAFANTEGGRLLIGVKDNGSIAGVRSEEEYYMVEAAAGMYSKPPIPFTTRQHQVEGKIILEIDVAPSTERPHYALDDAGKWLAYFRYKDENKLANKVMLEVWKKEKRKTGILISYSDNERTLLDYLEKNSQITVSRFARLAHIPYRKAEQIIIDFTVLHILTLIPGEQGFHYSLNQDFDRSDWEEKHCR